MFFDAHYPEPRPRCNDLFKVVGVAMACLAWLGVAGCADRRATVVPVSGQVLLDGKPLTLGSIFVIPKQGRAASGKIDSDGRFTLTTYKQYDGCILGAHAVEVIAQKTLPDKAGGEEGSFEWIAPARYAQSDTSGLTVAIAGPTDSLLVELFSKPR